MNDTTKQVLEVLESITGYEYKEADAKLPYEEVLEIDSLDHVEFSMELESRFNVVIADEEMFTNSTGTVEEFVMHYAGLLELKGRN